ncbi:alpha/beta hydrolase [Bifidobacterium tsurumiense]|uniref:Lipase n=2 Tax=Bifidobacterium tsurumiense TaxID=356829 RepID=A0A087EI65_9BIFI|nr:alpha/beta hydrolase [Bifidobacterium tsurumiense]KFJ07466.1 lipase [Bifidobacterium tsurumiense]MDY4678221.1 alpha/beta hydrolase [Bifidobacterium tsurumiense]MSS13386.1 alpha/beta hydrolase [Bifidobacterium tsurumiense]
MAKSNGKSNSKSQSKAHGKAHAKSHAKRNHEINDDLTAKQDAKHRAVRKSYPGFDDSVLERAEYWSEMTADLEGLSQERAMGLLSLRYAMASSDLPRVEFWHDPDNIDITEDIAYLPDGGMSADEVRGHLLDLYLPHDAVVRGGHTTPVYIDIHGGGFTYGYKELNRNFNTHLAEQGFAVFSLNYRPAPQTNLRGQLADIQAALVWIRDHIAKFPVNPDAVFITGDSAGAALAALTLAIENSDTAAKAFGIDQASGIGFAGGALISGVYNLTGRSALEPPAEGNADDEASDRHLENNLGKEFFADLEDAIPFLSSASLARSVNLPPLFLITSSDDFIEAETLELAAALSRQGADFELHDVKTTRTQSLGHVFPVCMTWLEESQDALAAIRDFSYERIR